MTLAATFSAGEMATISWQFGQVGRGCCRRQRQSWLQLELVRECLAFVHTDLATALRFQASQAGQMHWSNDNYKLGLERLEEASALTDLG